MSCASFKKLLEVEGGGGRKWTVFTNRKEPTNLGEKVKVGPFPKDANQSRIPECRAVGGGERLTNAKIFQVSQMICPPRGPRLNMGENINAGLGLLLSQEM